MKLVKLLTCCVFLFCIISCENDDESSGPNPNLPITGNFSDNYGEDINRDFLGRVIDINSNPIQGVTMSIGNASAITDANGIFIINAAQVFERFAYVKAEKVGYIHGSRAVVPSTGTNKVTIMLLEETVAQTVPSGEAATVTLANGASVALDGNYKKEDGSSYSGSVNVIMHMLDPTDGNMEQQMPGMLYAENTQGEERMLQTMGMLAVELRGDNGEDLNLADGATSEITIPLDASLLANAPSTIPLWYFDEANGYWKEEGQASLVGNQYIGNVSHFSFWNCDIPAEAINLCVTVKDENNTALSNLKVSITSTTYGTANGYTNEKGEVCGFVPSNEVLELKVYNQAICGNSAIHSESIGPYSQDSSITISIISSPDIVTETVIGTFNTCAGNPVSNGYAILTYEGQKFYDNVDSGNFEISLLRCSQNNTFTIEASDYDNLETTGEIANSFTTPITNLGTLISCDTVNEFIRYQIDTNDAITYISNLGYDLGPPEIYLSGAIETQIDYNFITLIIPNNVVGTYNSSTDTISLFFDDGLGNTGDPNGITNDIVVNLTAFGNVGEYIDANFSGTYIDDSGTHTITGTIHKIRDF